MQLSQCGIRAPSSRVFHRTSFALFSSDRVTNPVTPNALAFSIPQTRHAPNRTDGEYRLHAGWLWSHVAGEPREPPLTHPRRHRLQRLTGSVA